MSDTDVLNISPNDKMFSGGVEHYRRVGGSAVSCVAASLAAAGVDESRVASILDLPCGHGRVLRALKERFPKASLDACDIDVDGVEFCATAFGARGIAGHEDPSRIQLAGEYDLIWCGSLLTHLPAAMCTRFLETLTASLAPLGVLVVTLHGREVVRRIDDGRGHYGLGDRARRLAAEAAVSSFTFAGYGDDDSYGISISLPSWVIERVSSLPDIRLVAYIEAGWDEHQDVVGIQRLR